MQTTNSAGQRSPRPGPMPKGKAKAKAKAKVGPMPVPPVPVAVPAPVGAPAALQVEVLDTATWFARIINDVRAADEVIMGSFMFDHLEVTRVLLERLWGQYQFDATVLVDKAAHASGTCFRQRSRLDELRRAHAEVYLCRGAPLLGAFHMKAVVVDRRYADIGSSNLTMKSLSNYEFQVRVVGPPVHQIIQHLLVARGRGERWLG